MNYTSPEKPILEEQPPYMPSPHLSSRSSGSTIEDEIDNALSQLQITTNSTENWDVQQVSDWLKSVGLDSVSANFIGKFIIHNNNYNILTIRIDQEITGDILLDLNIETLKELGINTFGKRYKVMQAITLLKERDDIKPIPNASVSTSAISRPTSRRSIPTSLRRSNSQTSPSTTAEDAPLYQFPRKAPLPPSINLSPPTKPIDLMRPISPQSLNSSISRSNTFNTVSSGGTLKSRDLSPDPKGFQSPRRVLSQKSQSTTDSSKNDWSMISDTNIPTTSTSTPRQPM